MSSIGIISTAIGGLGNIWAQHKAGKTAKKGRNEYIGNMDEMLSGQRQDISSLLGQDAYRNYLDTDQAQSLIRTTQDQLRENANRIRGGIASSGGTTEAAIAGQTAMNKGYSDTVNRIAGHGTMYNQAARMRLMDALRNQGMMEGAFAKDKFSINQSIAQGYSDAGKQFSNSMTDLGSSMGDDLSMLTKLIGIG